MQHTLCSWFDVPWLRPIIGEPTYLKLESPRILTRSFRVTVSATLLYLLDQRTLSQKNDEIDFQRPKRHWHFYWNPLVISHHGNFDDLGEPKDELSQLLLLDLVTPPAQTALKDWLAQHGKKNLPPRLYLPSKKSLEPWQRPVLFRPEYQATYAPLEELLCGWLAACECIQPSDILSLQTNNYSCEYNSSDRLIAMQCNYYKGRSGAMMQPNVLMGNDIWTQALHQYIKGLPDHKLFQTNIHAQKNLTITSSDNSDFRLLFKIWKLPSFKKYLYTKIKAADADDVFIKAILALEHGSEPCHIFRSRKEKKTKDYYSTVERPLPSNAFKATHIKNTAVHAGSDTYREYDLTNHNSHTSPTEGLNYLTDQNKDWVNQLGRITRVVLNDLLNVAFNPSITEIKESLSDKSVRTRIIDAAQSDDLIINSLGSSHFPSFSDREIIVPDTLETALYFVHYLAQAEKLIDQLVLVRPDWVEQTLIVQVEWTTQTLSRMKSAATAQREYPKYSDHLPPLFEHLLETAE